MFFLSFVDFIIFKSLFDLELATKDISKGIGLVLECINEVVPLNETNHSKNSFLLLIVAERDRTLYLCLHESIFLPT